MKSRILNFDSSVYKFDDNFCKRLSLASYTLGKVSTRNGLPRGRYELCITVEFSFGTYGVFISVATMAWHQLNLYFDSDRERVTKRRIRLNYIRDWSQHGG